MTQNLHPLYQAILEGNVKNSKAAAEKALNEKADPKKLVSEYMIPAMDEVGRKFESGEFFVPEMLLAARAMKGALQVLTPALVAQGAEPVGKVVIGTVKGDLHDIGKNLVSSMLEGGGFQVTDLGVDVPPEKFVEIVQEKKADLVCLSALLTTTMPMMKTTIEAFQKASIRNQFKVMVGGAPVTQRFSDEIGADAYGDNAGSAVAIARKLLGIAA